MKITIDENGCIGCGTCSFKFPEFFAVNNDGITLVLKEVIPEELHKQMWTLQESCPVQAFEIN